jgi:hypothetical protein
MNSNKADLIRRLTSNYRDVQSAAEKLENQDLDVEGKKKIMKNVIEIASNSKFNIEQLMGDLPKESILYNDLSYSLKLFDLAIESGNDYKNDQLIRSPGFVTYLVELALKAEF